MAFTSGFDTGALALSLGGAISSGIGGFFSAAGDKTKLKTQAIIDEGNAHLADVNARIAELGAQSALAQGNQQVGVLTLRAGQLKGSQRASLAANGVDLGSGNAAEIQASTDILKQMDVNTTLSNAVRNAWGYRTQEVNYKNQALMDRAGAATDNLGADSISPLMAGASSLLGSAGQVANTWYMFNKGNTNNSVTTGIK